MSPTGKNLKLKTFLTLRSVSRLHLPISNQLFISSALKIKKSEWNINGGGIINGGAGLDGHGLFDPS